ncbi:putative short-chain dehydrogenases/reductase [Panus rudis PR-1116 ss-1]|nr:putative short-chain dehydrogenases/reductase [Panus rudis PR-1116 ss-1]
MPTFLITGSSRGIGLGLATKLLKDPKNTVLATARNPAESQGLQDLVSKYPKERVITLTLDVTSPEQISSAAKEAAKLCPDGLDYFIHNAGYWEHPFTPLEQLDIDAFQKAIAFHTTSAVHLLREFKPLVQKSVEKKFIFMSSDAASLTLAPKLGGNLGIPYSVGKAAQNMLLRKWGIANQEHGITVALIHPGFVDTEMIQDILEDFRSRNIEPISVEESVNGVLKVVFEVQLKDTAKFWFYNGDMLPW